MTRPLVTIDLTAADPPFEQVRAQVARRIAGGDLREGDRLPTVRALATELGLAVNTVARAYKELEADGLVTTGRRAGTVVAPGAQATDVALGRSARGPRRAGRSPPGSATRRRWSCCARPCERRGPSTEAGDGTPFWRSGRGAPMLSESSTDPSAVAGRGFGEVPVPIV
ncbi:hypothetical protein GCM10027517_18890 [Phycicoccus ginsengisoli]